MVRKRTLRDQKSAQAEKTFNYSNTRRTRSVDISNSEILISIFSFVIFATFVLKIARLFWLRLCRAVVAVGVILLVLPISKVFAQERDLSRQPGRPPDVQVVQTKELTVITLAGVGPQDKDGKLAAPEDFAGQFKQTWENLRRLMASAGSPLRNIVSVTVYTTDAKWQDTFKELQQESFSDWNPATSFAVSQQLRTPGALLEIHAVAVIDNRRPVRR
jgi:enamine deaminase RidA (YjgF/YER057c/UK114 family)